VGDSWLRLSGTEFFLLLDAAELGEPPAVLNLRHVGHTRPARAELAEQASQDLLDRGLGTVHQPADDLADVIQALGNRELALALATESPDRQYRVLAVNGRQGSAIAVTTGTEVALRTLRPTALVDAVVTELHPLPAGPGVTANVAWSDYLRACKEGELDGVDGFLWALSDTGMRIPEARTIAHVVTDRHGAGQLDIGGRVGPPSDSINWIDTAEGRYVLRRRDDWLSVIPANPAKLSQLITESLPT
jgi:hypothetical protein